MSQKVLIREQILLCRNSLCRIIKSHTKRYIASTDIPVFLTFGVNGRTRRVAITWTWMAFEQLATPFNDAKYAADLCALVIYGSFSRTKWLRMQKYCWWQLVTGKKVGGYAFPSQRVQLPPPLERLLPLLKDLHSSHPHQGWKRQNVFKMFFHHFAVERTNCRHLCLPLRWVLPEAQKI